MAKKITQPMEIVEVDTVETEVKETIKPVAGQVFPTKLVNPMIGEPGHYCLDPQGRYQPDWVTIYIHKATDTASRQPFLGEGGKMIYVKTGQWVDVPAVVVQALAQAKYDNIKMDVLEEGGIATRTEHVVQSTPRFQYSSLPSA